jgi:hypothetical protein
MGSEIIFLPFNAQSKVYYLRSLKVAFGVLEYWSVGVLEKIAAS